MDKFIPKSLAVELTNRCNFNCSYCARKFMSRKIFDMDIDFYKYIINSCPFIKIVNPYCAGEPLLYPYLIEAISYAKNKNKVVSLFTNASLLTKDLSEQLLDIGLDEITYSVDGFNNKTFSTRVGASWSLVLKNIETFDKLKRKGGYNTETIIRACITEKNKFHILKFLLFWKKRVDRIRLKPELKDRHLKRYGWYNDKPTKQICVQLTNQLNIHNNGNVTLCCQDYYGDYVFGNITEKKPLDIFNNKKFNYIRNLRTEGIYPLICDECYFTKYFKISIYSIYEIFRVISNKIGIKFKGE